ncbi:MAG: transposase [Clostridia bacterium]|nr:transposase [Clostridia bacterium]
MGRKSDYSNGMYKQLQEIMGRLETVEKDSKQKIDTLNRRIDTLEKENHDLKEENRLLRDDNARLKSIINNDSSNTSLPPSTDQKGSRPVNTFNGREKTERSVGGQKGHAGTTLTKSFVQEKLRSGNCRHEIRNVGVVSGQKYITKYILDLSVTPLITEVRIYPDEQGRMIIPKEYRSDVTYGVNVKAMAVSLYSEGVMSNDRIAAFLNAISKEELCLSEGSIYGFCKKFAGNAKNSIMQLETELLNQNVVATDATLTTVNGEQNYIRNFSTEQTVLYCAMKSKTIAAMEGVNFLKKYTGILVHDHETALYHFGTNHGECNVHLLRYLRKNTEDTGHKWSKEMTDLLCAMNRERKELIAQGKSSFPEETIVSYEQKYHALIAKGREENKTTAHKYAREEEMTLLNRMEKYSHNHLLFLHDFSVFFDDNISERDLRKAKNRQKMAGGFRKDSGHEMYCSILTIIETLKRRKMGLLENIKRLFMGAPAIF